MYIDGYGVVDSSIILVNAGFIDCRAGESGGAVYINTYKSGTVNSFTRLSLFKFSAVQCGGALVLGEAVPSDVQ
jgi:hypothetical protein